MSLDVTLIAVRPTRVFEKNITHNLGRMAKEAGLYQYLWRPDELGITKASELIDPLREGLKNLVNNAESLKQFNPANKWGDYDGLVEFVTEYLAACEKDPDATVSADR